MVDRPLERLVFRQNLRKQLLHVVAAVDGKPALAQADGQGGRGHLGHAPGSRLDDGLLQDGRVPVDHRPLPIIQRIDVGQLPASTGPEWVCEQVTMYCERRRPHCRAIWLQTVSATFFG